MIMTNLEVSLKRQQIWLNNLEHMLPEYAIVRIAMGYRVVKIVSETKKRLEFYRFSATDLRFNAKTSKMSKMDPRWICILSPLKALSWIAQVQFSGSRSCPVVRLVEDEDTWTPRD